MGFYRYRTIKKRKYLYYEERWREGKKVRSRSRLVKGSGPLATIAMTVGLPAMMAYDLISGQRVKELKEHLAKKGSNEPHNPVGEREWQRKMSIMSDAEFSHYKRHVKQTALNRSELKSEERLKVARMAFEDGKKARDRDAADATTASKTEE